MGSDVLGEANYPIPSRNRGRRGTRGRTA